MNVFIPKFFSKEDFVTPLGALQGPYCAFYIPIIEFESNQAKKQKLHILFALMYDRAHKGHTRPSSSKCIVVPFLKYDRTYMKLKTFDFYSSPNQKVISRNI